MAVGSAWGGGNWTQRYLRWREPGTKDTVEKLAKLLLRLYPIYHNRLGKIETMGQSMGWEEFSISPMMTKSSTSCNLDLSFCVLI